MPLGFSMWDFARHKHPKRNGPRRVVLRSLEVIRLCSGDLGLRLIRVGFEPTVRMAVPAQSLIPACFLPNGLSSVRTVPQVLEPQ